MRCHLFSCPVTVISLNVIMSCMFYIFQIPADTPIMFTRLDSERNAKVMKRALSEERLDQNKYEVILRLK